MPFKQWLAETRVGVMWRDWDDSRRELVRLLKENFLNVVLPALLLLLVLLLLGYRLAAYLGVNYLLVIMTGLGLVLPGVFFIFYSFWKLDEARKSERNLPLMILQMAVLSLSNLSTGQIIRRVSEMEEYGPLTETMKGVNRLVQKLHIPVWEALKAVADDVPGPKVQKFLTRFAHALEIGESPKQFLTVERQVVLDEYSYHYARSLADVENLRDQIAALLTAALFLASFVFLIQIIVPIDFVQLLSLVALFFMLLEGFLTFTILSKLPLDLFWYTKGPEDYRLFTFPHNLLVITSLALGAIMMVLLLIILYSSDMRLAVKIAIGVSPLLFPGIVIGIQEYRVRDRENNFPAFLRALKETEEAEAMTFPENIKRISRLDFGYLGEVLQRLSRRLSTRIKPIMAWRRFSAESGSYLISRYGEMLVHGEREGADLREVINYLEPGFTTTLKLRQERIRIAGSHIGLLYGLLVALVFTLYVIMLMLTMIGKQVAEMHENLDTKLFYEFIKNITELATYLPEFNIMMTTLFVTYSLIFSFLITQIRGGHWGTACIHFVGMVWCGSLIAALTGSVVERFA